MEEKRSEKPSNESQAAIAIYVSDWKTSWAIERYWYQWILPQDYRYLRLEYEAPKNSRRDQKMREDSSFAFTKEESSDFDLCIPEK